MCSPSVRRSNCSMPRIFWPMSMSCGIKGCLRAKASRLRVRSEPRSAAVAMSVGDLVQLLVRRQPLGEVFRIAQDDGQEIVEIVRHAAGELTHRLHLLGLAELLIELVDRRALALEQLGGAVEQRHQAAQFAARMRLRESARSDRQVRVSSPWRRGVRPGGRRPRSPAPRRPQAAAARPPQASPYPRRGGGWRRRPARPWTAPP